MSRRDDSDSEPEDSSPDNHNLAYQSKLAIHERDRYTCVCCRESFDDPSHLDADHNVPRGVGGADTIRNQSSLCRRCHEAKEGEREHAPTIRWMSTGDMIEKDFRWYRHFWDDMFPAITELALDYRLKPMRDLSDKSPYQARHIPLGDVRRISELLNDSKDVRYNGLMAHHYM